MRQNRSAQEVERDIARTREEMGTTIDALEDKFSAGQMIDQVSDWVRDGALSEQVREHPVPLTLIGAGIAWLLVENLTGTSSGVRRRPRRVGDYQTDPWQSGSGRYWREEDLLHEDEAGTGGNGRSMAEKASDAASSLKDRAAGAGERAGDLKDRASGAAGAARERAAHLTGEARTRASELGHRASERWDDARYMARRRAGQARRGFWSMLHENPLAVGGAAMAVGFIAGLAAPSTELEDRLMGDAASSLKHQAKDAAREAGDTASAVARDTAEAARRETGRDDGRSLAEKVRDAGAAAASEARSSAERHEATPGHAKEKAREAGDEARERTRNAGRDRNPGA